LIQSVTHWDVKVADLSIIEDESVGHVVEGVFIMKDVLLQVMKAIFVALLGDG
jgi:hypothetical protein